MSLDNSSTIPFPLSNIDGNLIFPSNSNGSENYHIGPGSIRNFPLESFEEIQKPTLELSPSDSLVSLSSMIDPNPMASGNELSNIFPNVPINSNKQSDSVSSSDRSNSVTKDESKPILDKEKEKENLIGKKRQRARKEDKDDIRVKIKRAFYNISLRNKLNNKLKSIGSKKYFEKFPKHFASDPNKKRNKEILNMTLNQIFEKKELYNYEDDCGKTKYLYNLKTVKNEEIKKNEEFQKILNKTFRELYEEYINSEEFKINEISRLKYIKKEKDEYISIYKYLAYNLIKFFQ